MPVTTITALDALAALRDGATYIDVRSRAEFAEGRPAGAVNVPLLDHDEDSGVMMPNPDFVRVMRANFPCDAPLLVGCWSGDRASRAAQMLAVFGFTGVRTVAGGYEGWAPAGLPTDTASAPARAYADLLAAADARDE